MVPFFSVVSRHQDKIVLVTIAIIIVYCIYACITFYRALSHRFRNAGHIELDGSEDCEAICVQRCEVASVTEDEKGDEEDERQLRIESHAAKYRANELPYDLGEPEYSDEESEEETQWDLIDGDAKPKDRHTPPSEYISRYDADDVQFFSRRTSKAGASVSMIRPTSLRRPSCFAGERASEAEDNGNVNFGSMGTKGVRTVRGDVEISPPGARTVIPDCYFSDDE